MILELSHEQAQVLADAISTHLRDRTVVHLGSWFIPGEMRAFPADQLESAKAWVAGAPEDSTIS